MFDPRWRKVIRDLWNNKTRTALVVFSIAVGVAAIGVVASTYAIISRELPGAYARVNPTSANIFAAPFDDEVLRIIRNMGIVKEAEGRYTFRVTQKTDDGSDREILLTVISDYQNILINKIWSESGAWPPGKGQILIERASLPLLQKSVGDSLNIETPNGWKRTLEISGLARDLNGPAGTFTNQAKGYITFDTLDLLGYPRFYNELLITVDGNPPDREKVNQIANQVAEKIRKGDRAVYEIVLANPGRLWFEQFMTPMVSILGIMGVIILFMSGLLVINTISALMAQQIRQIGIMKAVGGRTSQIIWMYLFSMFLIGLIALVIAVPLGNLLTRLSVQLLVNVINFDIPRIVMPRQVLFLQVGLSMFVPVLAALIPVLTGARITVREAISDYGLSKFNYGQSLLDQWFGKIRGLPRPLLLSLRNTFRQKARLTLTLLSLSLASAIFIAVISIYASLTKTLDQALQFYGFDIVVQFNQPYRVEQISGAMTTLPGILVAETWDATNARFVLQDGTESDSILLVAPSTNTALIEPQLLAGRWLKPDDENAIVINNDVLRQVPDLRVGDQVTLNIEDKNSSWTVVGILRSVLSGPTIYANNSYFSRALDRYGQASSVYVQVTNPSSAFQSYMAKLLEDRFEKSGYKVGSTSTVAELRQLTISQYNVIFIFLTMMCLLLTIVGALSLTGTMSLNILERTREIGVLRAVGASDSSVFQIVIVEGLVIGVLSWLIGIFLAFPLGFVLGGVLGSGFLGERLSVTISFPGIVVWLAIVILLAAIASYLPAKRAVNLAVRDVLAYE